MNSKPASELRRHTFFRVVVEILFNEWRRIHRVEELVYVPQFQTYGVRMPTVRSGSVRQ